MKCLWVGRLARPDLKKPPCDLSREFTCWSKADDIKLRRMIGYMKRSQGFMLKGWVGDRFQDCWIEAYVDADFAGEAEHTKSTSGMFIVLRGKNTWFPLAWMSKRQTSTARSTTEAEIISAANAFYNHIIPLLDVCDTLIWGSARSVPHDFEGQMACHLMEGRQPLRSRRPVSPLN